MGSNGVLEQEFGDIIDYFRQLKNDNFSAGFAGDHLGYDYVDLNDMNEAAYVCLYFENHAFRIKSQEERNGHPPLYQLRVDIYEEKGTTLSDLTKEQVAEHIQSIVEGEIHSKKINHFVEIN